MGTYAGIDLHSSNNYIGIMDQDHKRLFGKRLPNSLDKILMVLQPFKPDLKGIIVESTYNWYLACRWSAGTWPSGPSGQSIGNQAIRRHQTHR